MSASGRLAIVVLSLVAAVLLLAVAVKYWPPEVEHLVLDAVGRLADAIAATWRRVGGRWVTLAAVGLAAMIGLTIVGRRRTLGLLIVEMGIVAGAALALLQPEGW